MGVLKMQSKDVVNKALEGESFLYKVLFEIWYHFEKRNYKKESERLQEEYNLLTNDEEKSKCVSNMFLLDNMETVKDYKIAIKNFR